jgi:hypothetical protein
MKNGKFSMFKNIPKVGTKYVKNIETGDIAEWKTFDNKTQEYEIESARGKISKIHESKISKEVTPDEELKFLRLKNKTLN